MKSLKGIRGYECASCWDCDKALFIKLINAYIQHYKQLMKKCKYKPPCIVCRLRLERIKALEVLKG